MQLLDTEGLIALSLQSGTADDSEALVKEDWGDIWDDDEASASNSDF